MNEPRDPNVTADVRSVPADSLAPGLTVGIAGSTDPLGTTDHARGLNSTEGGQLGAPVPAGGLPVVPGYHVLREIARGGMGRVLAAHDLTLERDVALKILLPGANADRFVRESKITARLPHPGIPPVYALGTLADGSPFLAMKLIAGQTLADEMKTADRPRLLQAFTQVCLAVGFAHSRGVIHRDLKPANVMVGAFGEVQVMDWGLAKDLTVLERSDERRPSESLCVSIVGTDPIQTNDHREPGESTDDRTQAGHVMGTPAYMAPEQARGEAADARADVFALGGILCAILTGQPPFGGQSLLEVIQRAEAADLTEALARLDGCGTDTDLIALCRRCLSPNPKDRLADGQAVAAELTAYLNGVQARLQAVERERAVAVARETEQQKRRRVQFTLAAAVLLVLAAGVAVSSYFAVTAGIAATAARKAEKNADVKAEDADREAKRADREAKEAKASRQVAERTAYNSLINQASREIQSGDPAAAIPVLNATYWELRGWEYGHLREAAESRSFVLKGHSGAVNTVAWSPDGKRVATGSNDDTARIWDAFTGHELLQLRVHAQAAVISVNWSPDGKQLAIGSGDGTVHIWDATSGRELLVLKGHTSIIREVVYSPDGKRIATGSYDATARTWDSRTGKELLVLQGHSALVHDVGWSPDGKRIVTGSNDATARIWDSTSGRELLVLKGHTEGIVGAQFSPDGTRVLSGACDNTARIWDAETGKHLSTLSGHSRWIQRVKWRPNGKQVATCSWDGTARVWDALTGKEHHTLIGHTNFILGLSWSPDGGWLLTGCVDGTARLWDINHRTRAAAPRKLLGGNSAAWSPSGEQVVTALGDIRVWIAATGKETSSLRGHTGFTWSVRWSPDETKVVTASSDLSARIWDAATGRELQILKGHSRPVLTASFSPNGKWIVTGSDDATVRIWDWESGRELMILTGHKGPVWSAVFSADGMRVLTGSGDATARIWDTVTGKELWVFKGHAGLIRSALFSPNGRQTLTASDDATARIWDSATGKEVLALRGHTSGLYTANWSPDGSRVVTGSNDNTARVWDPVTRQELVALRMDGEVWPATFSPDGSRIMTASNNGSGRIWESRFINEIATLQATSLNPGVSFSADSRRLFVRDDSGRETVTDLPPIHFPEIQPPAVQKGEGLVSPDGRFEARIRGKVIQVVARSPLTLGYDPWAEAWAQHQTNAPVWHLQNALESEQGGNWFAAAFHLRRALQYDPENATLQTRLTRAERRLAANARLPAILRGEDNPTDNAERLGFAQISYDQKRFVCATRLWAAALASDPSLGDDSRTQHRYNAARAAVLAAAGQDQSEPPLDDAAKTTLRGQALDWLKTELAALDKLPESNGSQTRPWDWRKDSDLASIRDAAALAKLPVAEQKQWQALWAEVEAFSSFGEHFNRGLALSGQGKLDEAIAEYRTAIRRRPDFAEAYGNLGRILQRQGSYAGALDMFRKGHELGSQRPDWRYPSAQWVEQSERVLALSMRFLAMLRGEDKPADNAERLVCAQLAYDQKKYSFATQLWAEALKTDPKLGDSRQTQHAYNAACAAVLAAAGQDQGEPPLDDAAKATLRGQALDWLKAELTAWDRFLESDPLGTQTFVVENLSHWQKDADLAGIRDAAALARLPDAEQQEWQALWTKVEATSMNAKALALEAVKKNWERAIVDYSKLITPETTDAALLAKRAAAYLATENWNLARADWLRVVEQQPDQIPRVFEEFKKAKRWTEAAEFGLRLVQEKPNDSQAWLRIAPVLALPEDQAAYADFCGRMVQQFAESKLPEDAERVVKASLLRADSIDLAKLPGDKLAKLLDDGTAPNWFLPWGWCARALLAYRKGDARSAVTYVTKSEEHMPAEFAHALNLVLLAMSQHQLQHPMEARRALDEASQLINRLQADEANKGYHDLLIAQILFGEAESLITGTTKPNAGDDKAVPHSSPQKEQ